MAFSLLGSKIGSINGVTGNDQCGFRPGYDMFTGNRPASPGNREEGNNTPEPGTFVPPAGRNGSDTTKSTFTVLHCKCTLFP